MNYFISDLHFGCANEWDGRAIEHDRILIDNWNKVVTNGDDVWILGDIGRTGGRAITDELIRKIAVLKGRKHLILGNHDELDDARLRQLFVSVSDYKELKWSEGGRPYSCVMSHYPILMWNGQHKGAILLYGHLHGSEEERIFQQALISLNDFFKSKTAAGRTDCPPAIAINCGAMLSHMDYCPKTITQLMDWERNNDRTDGK